MTLFKGERLWGIGLLFIFFWLLFISSPFPNQWSHNNQFLQASSLFATIGFFYGVVGFLSLVGMYLFIDQSKVFIVLLQWWQLFLAVFSAIFFQVFISPLVSWLFLNFFGITPDNRSSLITKYIHSPLSLCVMIFILLIFAPITEELFFRGFLFRWMEKWSNALLASFGSSLFFMAGHLVIAGAWYPVEAILYFLFGLIASGLFKLMNNLGGPILFHITFNAFFVLLLLVH